MTSITEADVEQAALDWLSALGWKVAHGPDTPPGTPNAERTDYGQVALERRLHNSPHSSVISASKLTPYLDASSNLSISEVGPMTHRQILDLFINGDLSHTNNATTEANYRSICETAFFPLFQDDFTKTVRLFMSALNEIQQINCVALDQLRRVGTPS